MQQETVSIAKIPMVGHPFYQNHRSHIIYK